MNRIILASIFAILYIQIALISTQTDQDIEEQTSSHLVGDNATLACPTLQDDEQYGSAIWTRNGQELVAIGTKGQPTPSSFFDDSKNEVTKDRDLKFYLLATGDSGEYVCKVNFMESNSTSMSSRSTKHKLNVAGPPDTMKMPWVTTVTSTTASIHWETNTQDNNSPINAYILMLRDCNSEEVLQEYDVSSSDHAKTLNGLTPTKCYTVTVSARNAIDKSPPSPPSNKFYTPTDDSPNVMDKPRVSVISTSEAQVSWEFSTLDNIDTYILVLKHCNMSVVKQINVLSMANEKTITDLTPGTCYVVTVQASNVQNKGTPSPPSDEFYTTTGDATDTNSTVGTDFNTTTTNTTAPNPSPTTIVMTTTTTTTTTEKVLIPPHRAPYEFKGQSLSSTGLKLTWKRPGPEVLQGNIEGYEIKYGINDLDMKDMRLEDPDKTETILQGLRPYTLYQVSIRAYNSAGRGPLAVTTLQTKQGVPTKPRITHISQRNSCDLYVHWEPPQLLNGQLVRYLLRWSLKNGGNSKMRFITGHLTNPMNAFIQELTPYTDYLIQVAAETGGGKGEFSLPYPALTDVAAPSAPRNLNVTVLGADSVHVSWDVPEVYNRTIDKYIIKYWGHRGNDYTKTINGDDKMYVLDHLTTNTRYHLNVAAITNKLFGKDGGYTIDHNVGDFSETVSFTLGTYTSHGNEIIVDGRRQGPPSESDDGIPPGVIAGVVIAILVVFIVAAVVVGYHSYTCRKCYQAAYLYLAVPSNGQSLQPTIINVEEPSEEKQYPDIPVNDFIAHCDLMHADSDIAFAQEFDEINRSSTSDKYACDSSSSPENRNKNRYINIVAYDHSRVVLKGDMGRPRQSDYINANYVDGYKKPKAYIATQGPLPHTFADFWRMVWEENTSVIVMITNLMEKGRRKCDQYWPNDGIETYGNINVKLITTVPRAHYTVRIFVLRNLKVKKRHSMKSAGERTVYHYHYTEWPDHGVPDYCLPVLSFVQKSASHSGPDSGPIIVHCSAGVGRTGTYILIDAMIAQITDRRSINVPGFTQHIRKQRNFLVQTEDQYIFIHSVLVEYLLGGGCTEVRQEHMLTYPTVLEQMPQDQLLHSLTETSLLEKQYKLATAYQPSDLDLTAALKSYNQEKNREGSILPVNIKRVLLPVRPGVEGSDYINASYLHGYKRSCEFVVTQHPTDDTMEDFWRMVWDRNSHVIIVLSPFDETEHKEFWPPKDSSIEVDSGNFRLTMKDEPFDSEDGLSTTYEFIMDSIQYDYTLLTRIICVKEWPNSCQDLSKAFDIIATAHGYINNTECGPVVVMDRFGGSTAATLCALWTLRDQMLSEKCCDFYQLAKLYHYKRPGVVGTQEDYLFLHKAVAALCLQLQMDSSGNSSPRHPQHHNHHNNHFNFHHHNNHQDKSNSNSTARHNGTLPRTNGNNNNSSSSAIPRSNTADGTTITTHSRNPSTAAVEDNDNDADNDADNDGGANDERMDTTDTTPIKENGGKFETNM